MQLLKKLKFFYYYGHIEAPLSQNFTEVLPLLKENNKHNYQVLQQLAKTYKRNQHKISDEKHKIIESYLLKYFNGSGRHDKIASLAWIVIKLDLHKKYRDLINEFVRRVDQDQWYVNFEESVRAMQAFYWIENDQIRSRIYQKIERNVSLTIWEVNMTYYMRISDCLIKAKRFDAPLWNKLQHHIMRNLDMSYNVPTLLNIFLNFSIANKGSKDFYWILQKTICKGHLFTSPLAISGLINHSFSSEYIATIVKTFSLAKKNLDMEIETQFKIYLQKIFFSKQFKLIQLRNLTMIIEYLSEFQYQPECIEEIHQALFKNIKLVDNYIYLDDVIQFYQKMKLLGIELPESVINDVNHLALYTMVKGPKNIGLTLEVYNYLYRNDLLINKDFELIIDEWLESQSKYFDKSDFKILISAMKQMNKKLQFKQSNIKIGISDKYEKLTLLTP